MSLACGAILSAVPSARYGIANLVDKPAVRAQGLSEGQLMPEGRELPSDGVIAFATQCAPCVLNTLRPAVLALAKGRPITLVVPAGRADLARGMEAAKLIEVGAKDYADFGLKADGTPHLFVVARGRVIYSSSAPEARLQKSYAP
ncbi:hypothetical protein EON81_00480 [bacterium]|nr:MAG: hypothetical protein EON81_00480 [bacterium]